MSQNLSFNIFSVFTLNQVPLDDYYSALKLYVQHKRYPAGIKDDYKRVIRKMAQNYVIEKDVLYYKSGSKLKKTVMDELERFKLLKEAHVLENGKRKLHSCCFFCLLLYFFLINKFAK